MSQNSENVNSTSIHSQEMNYKNTPHIILISLIFIFQFFTKRQEELKASEFKQKKKADKLFWKYIIIFNLAKAGDWCLGPFVHEFFSSYHGLNMENTAKMISISFGSSLFFGPSLVGYLNDGSNKIIPLVLYCLVLASSCIIRLIKSSLISLIMAQLFFGIASSILYSSFENWFISEVDRNISNNETKEYILSAAFEKSMVTDAMIAVGVSFFAGYLKVS